MKFTKGEWMMREGVKAFNCNQIREARLSADGTGVYLYAVPYKEDVRGLGGPVQEIVISSPQKDVIRIHTCHFKGILAKIPSFELNDAKVKLGYTDESGIVNIRSGDTELRIEKSPCSLAFYYKGEKLTQIGSRYGSPVLSYMQTPDGPFMRAQLDVGVGEKVYGLGERFTPFVKNGQSVEIWNEDGGTCTEISYKNIPFYVTNRGYGVFVNDSGPVSFEVCSEEVMRVQFSVPGESLDFMFIGGGDMRSVLQNYAAVTGKPALPPAWTFGLWLTSSFTTSYDEETVNSFVDGMLERDIPLSVFHIDCFWMKENEWCGFEWDRATFPDAAAFLARLKEKGVHICVWINPYIGQKSPAFDEAAARGYLLKDKSGNVWQTDLWQAGMGIVDFTNPEAVEWYKGKLRGLMAQGVDAFKTDFGERIPENCVYFDGSDPLRMHNYYTYLYNKAVFEVLEEGRGKNEACLFARSATVGGQKFPVHWGGDSNSTLSSMYESLRGGLSLCLSGFGFWSHDIGGFEGDAPAYVYKRWLAFGLLSTHSRLHGSTCYRVPWLFGEEAVDVCRNFAKLKNTLMPYLFAQAVFTHETGVPSMRAMVLEFPGDLTAEDCDRQYMLGDSLLVAPVFTEEGSVDVYLPQGTWTNYFTGETVRGGCWRREKHGFFSLPLYVRENTILPVGKEEGKTVYDYGKNAVLKIYALQDKAECAVYDASANLEMRVSAARKGKKVRVCAKGLLPAEIVLVGVHSAKAAAGAEWSDTAEGICLRPQAETVEIELQ